MQITPLPWDTEHFGYKIGQIQLKDFSAVEFNKINADLNGFDLIYIFSKSYELSIGPPVNTKILYQENLNQLKYIKYSNIEMIGKDEFNRIHELSLVAGRFSRFVLDTNFKKPDFEALYLKWVEKSFSSNHYILGYKVKESILGMVSLQLNPEKNIANIELIGVDQNAQGQKIGQQLISASIDFVRNNSSLEHLSVYTQKENILGCKFYEKMGFSKKTSINIHHIWKK